MAIIKFRCGRCGEVHDDYATAIDCCQPGIRILYCCDYCDTEHTREADADACCEAEQPA